MAIYRPPKPRWPLAVSMLVAGLLLGSAIGFAWARASDTTEEVAKRIRSELLAAAGSLDVAAIEYEEAVGSGGVEKETEYRGALAAVASSRARFEDVRSALEQVASERVGALDTGYEEVETLMEDAADPADVLPLLEELESVLSGETG